MSLKGWGIALLLSPFTIGISLILYFYYWFFKKIGKWYVRALKIFFLMPLAIVLYIIATIVEAVIGDAKWIVSIFTGGIKNMEVPEGKSPAISIPGLSQFKLRYLFALTGALAISAIYFIQPLVQGGIPEFSIHTFTNFFAVGLPFFILVVFSGIWNKYQKTGSLTGSAKEASGKGIAVGAGAAGAAAAAPAAAAAQGKEAAELAESGVGMYEDLQAAGSALEGAEAAGAAAEGAEGILAAVGGGAASSVAGPIIVGAIASWLFFSALAIFISGILFILTWGYVTELIPVIGGPILAFLGLGQAYGEWIGGAAEDRVGPQVDSAFEEERQAISQVTARVGCMLEGPQCMREWRMNNTVRPGSEEVGQTYELRIEEFGMGTDRLDTAFKESDFTIPINFLVANTRHGIRGITAEDVHYRIRMMDSDEVYCSTDGTNGDDWVSINSQGIEATEDLDPDDNEILPGLGVTPTESLDELNLADCELLQPAMGLNRVLEMQLRYNYSSQATLDFEAMSREHRRDVGIEPGFQQSETARTPVQSYINVESPATFYETQSGRNSVPFSVRVGFETDMGVEYRVNPESIRVIKSDLTEPIDGSCSGLRPVEDEGENVYTISEDAKERIQLRQEDQWFSGQVSPSPLRCTMELSDPDQISETGEQLLMRVDADYQIRRSEEMEAFSVWNTACERQTCPMLVTEQYANEYEDETPGLFYECSGSSSIDSRDGCSIRVPDDEGEEIDWQLVSLAERDDPIRGEEEITIEEDTKAVRGHEYFQERIEAFDGQDTDGGAFVGMITPYTENDIGNLPVGVNEEELQRVEERQDAFVAYEPRDNPNNVRFEGLPGRLCELNADETDTIGSHSEAVEEYLIKWGETKPGELYTEGDIPYMIVAEMSDCERGLGEWVEDQASCGASNSLSTLDAIGSAILTGNLEEFEEDEDCMDHKERALACVSGETEGDRGILIESGGDLQCYQGQYG